MRRGCWELRTGGSPHHTYPQRPEARVKIGSGCTTLAERLDTPANYYYSYLIASPGFILVARRSGKKITITVPTIANTSDQPT
jgi:hypothetical protein